jgi:putative phosphoribosyl transferase
MKLGETVDAQRLEQVGLEVAVGPRCLSGILGVRDDARGLVARELRRAGLGTLLFDLLQVDEEGDREKVFDIELLAERLQEAADWVRSEPQTQRFPLGYFGASTGAAAALVAAARQPAAVGAVVSRGGRPDLAGGYLKRVEAPTLLIVGGSDAAVLHMNEEALAVLTCPKQLAVVPGATHLFPEPGALEEVARLAAAWFAKHLDHGDTLPQ